MELSMIKKKAIIGRAVAILASGTLLALSATGCSAGDDTIEVAGEEDAMSVDQAISQECRSAARDVFIDVRQNCSGCINGKYDVQSGTNYSANPCTPYHIADVGGDQQKITVRTLWQDNIPTTQATCTAAKLIQTWNYRGTDVFTDTKSGTWLNGQCFPPQINRQFTHAIQSGLPGEFFAHLRILTDAKTAITHGKRFKFQICRGHVSC
jgi:hypothetical protein